MPDSPKISFRLPPDLHALLVARVGQGSRVSDVLREALETYLGLRPPSGQTEVSAASDVADAMSDIIARLAALASDVANALTRLAHLEQRVDALATRPTDRPTPADVSDAVSDVSDRVDTLTAQMANLQARLAQLIGPETPPMPPVRQRPTQRPTAQQQPGAAVAPHIQAIAEVAAQYDKLSLAQLAQLLYERNIYRARDKQTGEEKVVNRGTLKLWLDRARAAGLL